MKIVFKKKHLVLFSLTGLLYRVNFNRENVDRIRKELEPYKARLVAVSKTKPSDSIRELYDYGQRAFGENYVQELLEKQSELPADLEWHFIGHLQSNKVKQISPFVSLIHGVDSLKLLVEINKQAIKENRIQDCLLQIFIATEETKFGLSFEEAREILISPSLQTLSNLKIKGFMGMASFSDDEQKVRKEFRSLRTFFEERKSINNAPCVSLDILSMGMTGDYLLALEEGSTMVRIGSAIFGERTVS